MHLCRIHRKENIRTTSHQKYEKLSEEMMLNYSIGESSLEKKV